ncbi:MAG: hypothetical protein COY75_05780 [Nitrospirae bacterium CG_4_10_14_0_8_um_filter_41_23]|nr:tetratricopeptide repeat protein [Nitrospirota bacterium]OIP59496.1 MAG: hypothetical protein AUK38_05360 [Nitrospirae bacterium CG2_30_41_42]PIQ94195.1 MAG: hypothetical protein COV68_05880 [Nitrospirae bacterium CG11_big_fil_rev_8_21_14_0_20_41_14]PIV43845.1 MAG: hypothetical protein COS27_03880 [Nitrospirae bacterium CG02_land_8_20_14_3_00_41_53]PIW87461.1 MAG: hypothetical protein COZ94_05025 [Nitrospirae bacterium CG_4_8_14_3_um_filter_41_47]PIY86880.1 MAG: hypothetical protein COY75_0
MIKTALHPILSTSRWVELLVVIATVVIYGWATYERNFVWKDEVTLWSDIIKKSPDKYRGYNEVGMWYYERCLIDDAIPYFEKGLSLNPYFGSAHNNLGLCFLGKGLIDPAIEEFKQAIRANPFNGMYHINLGIAYWQRGLNNLAYKEIQRLHSLLSLHGFLC